MTNWFDDIVRSAGFESMAALAREMRESVRWPPDDTRTLRTIGNRLAALRKGDDMQWWSSSASELLPAVEDVLGLESGELRVYLESGGTATPSEASIWRFDVFSALEPLDLQREELFPGIPTRLLAVEPPRHQRVWWQAAAGGGKSVVGRWLNTRHRWSHLKVDDWASLEVPESGAVYLELGSDCRPSREQLAELPAQRTIWIASIDPAPTLVPDEDGRLLILEPAFSAIDTQPAAYWANALVQWVADRVRPGGGFDASKVREFLDDLIADDLFSTPGDLIEFLGMVDELGLDDDDETGASALRWIQTWLNAIMQRSDTEVVPGVSLLLRRDGADLLITAECERIRRGQGQHLGIAEWESLFPELDLARPSAEQLIKLLDSGGETAVRRALQPDSNSLVAALRACGALQPTGDDRFALHPSWIANFTHAAAAERLRDEGALGYGALALHAGSSLSTLAELIEQVLAGRHDGIQAILASKNQSPETAAALELAFQALGAATLMGIEVPIELLRSVWGRHIPLVARADGSVPTRPLLLNAREAGGRERPLYEWYAAALAISHRLHAAGDRPAPSWVQPWKNLAEDSKQLILLARAAQHIAWSLDEAGYSPYVAGAWLLGKQLLEALGPLYDSSGKVLSVQSPWLAAALAAGRALPYEVEAERIQLDHHSLATIPAASECCGISTEMTLAWCWRNVWVGEGRNAAPFLGAGEPAKRKKWWSHFAGTGPEPQKRPSKTVWPALPPDAVDASLAHAIVDRLDSVGHLLALEVWRAGLWAHHGGWRSEQMLQFFQHAPLSFAAEVLRAGEIGGWDYDTAPALWTRDPELMLQLVDEFVAEPHHGSPSATRFGTGGSIAALVIGAPASHHSKLVQRAESWLTEHADAEWVTPWITVWLQRRIAERSPAWREAYRLLPKAPTIDDPS